MLTLRIFLLDLIAFVPQDGKLWALLPDARSPSQGEPHIEPHFPVVLFDTDEPDAGDWPAVKDLLGLIGPRRGRTWLLDREEVRISPAMQVLSGPISIGAQAPASVLPNSGSREDFAWVPRMQSIVPAAAQVDPACIASQTSTPKLIARMRIPAGRLRTLRFAGIRQPNTAGMIRPFEFKVGPTAAALGPARAIADAAVVDLQVAGNSVVLETVGLNNGAKKREFELKPRGSSRVVRLLLGNLSPLSPSNQVSGPHFDRYYDLAAHAAPQRPIPFVVLTGSSVLASVVNTRKSPDFLRQIDQGRLGGINRQICTFALLSA